MNISIYSCLLFTLIISALSCETFLSPFCTGEDEIPVNKVFVYEFITDQNFENITLLRSGKFGSDDELNGIGPVDYTIDGKFAITGDGILNYGSDLKSFNQELKLNTSFSNSGFNFIEGYNNLEDKYLTNKRYLSDILIPGSSDSITLNLDLAIEFTNSLSSDTIFLSKYQFIDSDTYEINSLQNLAYDRYGNIFLLINDWIINIEYQNGINRVRKINESHLIKINSENKFDTLFTYNNILEDSPYIQLRFSSTGAGIILSFDGNVYLLDQENKLHFLYPENLEGFLPDRSNLKGTAVFGDYGNQYYDFEREKHIDFTSIFYNTDKIVYGYPSNNNLIALKLSGTSSLNKNQEKIFIYDTISESLVDSITFKDLSGFDIINEYDSIEGTYAKLTSPVFTPDNRLIFMYVYEESSYRCR